MPGRLSLLLLLLTCSLLNAVCQTAERGAAQSSRITGTVCDGDSGDPLVAATVQAYRISGRDTVFAGGTVTDSQGRFSIAASRSGRYELRVSFLGFGSVRRLVAGAVSVGRISLKAETVELAEAVVTANIPKMVIRDDTVVYNADAFRVPEGSVIEALVEALPGAKIDDSGQITINGKSVRRFKMDGRDFMTGNNEAVMKNLPSYVIDQVKAYEDKSDLARLTGIDDGNEDFVLEFVTKRSARKGLQANPDIGYGTDGRYGLRLTAMKPFGDMRYTIMLNANNVNGRNFTGRGGRGRGNSQGQREMQTAAMDISYEKPRKLKVSGRVTWNHSNADNWSRTGSESFVNTRGGAFSNSVSQSYQRSNGWTGNMNLQWTIDTLTTLSVRPDVSWSTGDSRAFSRSASFNANPFDYVDDPLSDDGLDGMHSRQMAVNGRRNRSLGYNEQLSVSSNAQLFRRLSRGGRNIALSTSFSLRDSKSRNASLSAVHLYQQQDSQDRDSTYQTNRYTLSEGDNLSYAVGVTYTEPLLHFKQQELSDDDQRQRGRGRRSQGQQGLFLQLNYRYRYSHQKSAPSTYDFPDYDDAVFDSLLDGYREWTALFGFLDNPYESYLSSRLSRYSERTEHTHQADVQLRYVRGRANINVGLTALPQRSHYVQQYLGRPVDTVRTVTNLSPTLNMRFRFNQQTNLQVRYRGQTQQPSITQLLDIYDDTNPLSITMGNPGLKPSFTSSLSANFQMQRQPVLTTDSLGQQVPLARRHWSFNSNASWQVTANSIGNIVTYNETTGGRTTRPENINGNWSAQAAVGFTIGLDSLNRWDVSGSLNGSYNHRVSYVNLNRTAVPDRNITHSTSLSPSLSLSFRNKWLSVSVNGRTTYARTENRLQASNNLTTWNYSYGMNTKITFPWGTNLSTDGHMFSKRGYADASLNTNELIWNAQLSHSFLRGKLLTVMLQWYDILRQQTNFSRTVNANGWRDTEVNTITSYAMLHVSYRLNLFKNNRHGQGFDMPSRGDGPRGDAPRGARGMRRNNW